MPRSLVCHRLVSRQPLPPRPAPRLAVRAKCNIGEHAFRHLLSLQFRPALCPGLDLHRDGELACMLEGAVAGHLVPPSIGRRKRIASMLTVTTRPCARRAAKVPPARSICDSVQPPKIAHPRWYHAAWQSCAGTGCGRVRNLIRHPIFFLITCLRPMIPVRARLSHLEKCLRLIGLRPIGAAPDYIAMSPSLAPGRCPLQLTGRLGLSPKFHASWCLPFMQGRAGGRRSTKMGAGGANACSAWEKNRAIPSPYPRNEQVALWQPDQQ